MAAWRRSTVRRTPPLRSPRAPGIAGRAALPRPHGQRRRHPTTSRRSRCVEHLAGDAARQLRPARPASRCRKSRRLLDLRCRIPCLREVVSVRSSRRRRSRCRTPGGRSRSGGRTSRIRHSRGALQPRRPNLHALCRRQRARFFPGSRSRLARSRSRTVESHLSGPSRRRPEPSESRATSQPISSRSTLCVGVEGCEPALGSPVIT